MANSKREKHGKNGVINEHVNYMKQIVPKDVYIPDENDSAQILERWIRDKYERKKYTSSSGKGSKKSKKDKKEKKEKKKRKKKNRKRIKRKIIIYDLMMRM